MKWKNKDNFEEQIALFMDPLENDSYQQLDIFKTTAEDFFEAQLQELRVKYQVSIENPNEVADKPANSFLPSLKDWINQEMPYLHDL